MASNGLKIVLKFLFAGGLIYWLVSSGKLDFSILAEALQNPWRILAGFAALFIVTIICAWRWKYILEVRLDSKLPFLEVVRCNWIGQFFNSVLPGSVTGDIIKIVYIRDLNSNLSVRFLIGTVLLDRVIGLFGLILMLGLFSLLNYQSLQSVSPLVANLINLNLILFFCVIFGIFSLYFFEKIPRKILEAIEHIHLLHKIGAKLLKIWDELCLLRSRLILLTLVSVVVHITAVMVFWLVASPYASGEEFQLGHAFSFIPIGLVSLAIPIAPSGLGVGHAVFHKLFSFFHITNGASLFNIFFFVQVVVNLLGVIPYLMRKKHSLKESQQVFDENQN